MKVAFSALTALGVLIASANAWAATRTVTLAVTNMTCPTCPYIIKQSLAGVSGVEKVIVSFERKTATVTFDDSKTSAASLAEVSAQAGFPAQPAQ